MLHRQRGVTAREHQRQPLVAQRAVFVGKPITLSLETSQRRDLRVLAPLDCDSSEPVNGLPSRRRDKPTRRVRRHTVNGPTFERSRDRVLQGILGQVDVPDRAHQHGQDPARLILQRAGERLVWTHRSRFRTVHVAASVARSS